MEAKFIENVPNARILRNKLDAGNGKSHKYFIERAVLLKHHFFINFREHLSGENDIVKNHLDDMFIDDNGVWHVIMVCSVHADIMLLIYNDGTNCAKHVAIKTNGGEQVEPKFTIKNRY
ncbi:MAG: hypothetical protein MR904_00795 [Clostridia bacterium]|nr:hypothetical protein [Clostridia bacterium]